jgi:hypothetical protein
MNQALYAHMNNKRKKKNKVSLQERTIRTRGKAFSIINQDQVTFIPG